MFILVFHNKTGAVMKLSELSIAQIRIGQSTFLRRSKLEIHLGLHILGTYRIRTKASFKRL